MRATILSNMVLAAILLMFTGVTSGQAPYPMGTAFTYQGQLKDGDGPVSDTCDFEFSLWDDATGGTQKGSTVPATTSVDDGLFTVELDFGEEFDGQARWLEMAVCCPSSCTVETLDPRQELTPAPYSLRASNGVGGPDALNVTTDDKVGIGTDSPEVQLDVNGAARATALEITGGSPIEGGPLAGWGRNINNGQADVPPGTFTAVAGGEYHSLAIRTDGTLAGWGTNNYGQTDVPAGTFTAVAGGNYHSLAIRTDGTLAGWGRNDYGQTDVPAGTFTAVAGG